MDDLDSSHGTAARRGALALALTLAACTAKKGESAAAPPVAEVAPRAVATGPAHPDAATSGGLPLECQRYRALVAGIPRCPALPSLARDGVMRTYYQLENAWAAAPADLLTEFALPCAMAADALVQTVGECPAIAAVPAVPAAPATGSRNLPSERGVPLDQATLGPLPHPFGALEFLTATTARDEILSALPNARRDGEATIIVPLGVEDLMAEIALDYTGHLDVVTIRVPATARAALVEAWGPPTATDGWFDRPRRWRADLDGEVLTISPFVPLAALVGKGPDGLAETQALIGATPAELTQRFGDRIEALDDPDDDRPAAGAPGYGLLLPATEVCRYYTKLDLAVVAGRVATATLRQCLDDEAGRRPALAALESRWGRATPARGADDLPVFRWNLPGRRVDATVVDASDGLPAWQLVITAR